VRVETREGQGRGWRVYDCEVGEGRVYSVFMLFSSPKATGLLDVVREARRESGTLEEVWAWYVDVSAEGMVMGTERDGIFAMVGMVPCRSIWDGEGRRIAAVLLFDRVCA
jgi:hypothetical protein